MTHVHYFLRLAFIATLGVTGACSDPDRAIRAMDDMGANDEDSGTPSDVMIDETQVLAMANDYANSLSLFSAEPEQSQTHPGAAAVLVWGTDDMFDRFAAIDPDDPTQSISFDPGTMLVKEHLDDEGDTIGITVMYKAPPGYDPEARDWFWASLHDGEVPDTGHVDLCIDCHSAAHNTDLVVGFQKSQ